MTIDNNDEQKSAALQRYHDFFVQEAKEVGIENMHEDDREHVARALELESQGEVNKLQ